MSNDFAQRSVDPATAAGTRVTEWSDVRARTRRSAESADPGRFETIRGSDPSLSEASGSRNIP